MSTCVSLPTGSLNWLRSIVSSAIQTQVYSIAFTLHGRVLQQEPVVEIDFFGLYIWRSQFCCLATARAK